LNRHANRVARSSAIKRFAFGQKIGRTMEQKAVVAVPSQLRTITAAALPRSNQITATLFELI